MPFGSTTQRPEVASLPVSRWLLVASALLVALLLLTVVQSRAAKTPSSIEALVPALVPVLLSDASELERGAYLVTAGNCASCHTAPGGALMAGGLRFQTPFGALYSTNITPHPEEGIGAWTLAEFTRAMRLGERPNGEHLYPAFPYTAYTRLSDADIGAIFAFLRTLAPVSQPVPANELAFPYRPRPLLALWTRRSLTSGPQPEEPLQSGEWHRGRYLAEALAHCSACHSPRNALGAEDSKAPYGGGLLVDLVEVDKYREWSAPNLSSSAGGLGAWHKDELADYLHTARNRFLESFGPMNEVIMNSTRYLQRDDVDAMAVYLKSLPAIATAPGDEPDPQVLGRGRTVYNLHCGTCHLPTGAGDPQMGPRLNQGSLVVLDGNPASMINAILYGPQAPEPPLPEKWRHPMGEFQYELSDAEVAAVATYVRNSWQNRAGVVTEAQVAAQR